MQMEVKMESAQKAAEIFVSIADFKIGAWQKMQEPLLFKREVLRQIR